MPGEKKFNLGYENKAPFGFSRSVDAMGFVAMDLGAMWHCFCPYYHHQHPTLETDSPGLPAVSRWRLGPQRRMGLCPTIPKRDFWVQTLQGAERSKVNCLDSGCKKKRPVWWADFPSSSPPLPGHPLGAPQAGWWTYPSWLNFQAETSKITTRHLKSAFPAIPLSELFLF